MNNKEEMTDIQKENKKFGQIEHRTYCIFRTVKQPYKPFIFLNDTCALSLGDFR